jgi:hypothetical protein
MRGHGRLRPSPSMVVAFVALTVALGGTSYAIAQLPANSVGTKQLKKNAVTTAKVKNRSLVAKDFRSGQLPRGARGPAGPQGAPGTAGATNVTVRSAAGSGTATAGCIGAEKAVGGGGDAPLGFIDGSFPEPEAGTPTGWTARATDADGAPVNVTAYVICAVP